MFCANKAVLICKLIHLPLVKERTRRIIWFLDWGVLATRTVGNFPFLILLPTSHSTHRLFSKPSTSCWLHLEMFPAHILSSPSSCPLTSPSLQILLPPIDDYWESSQCICNDLPVELHKYCCVMYIMKTPQRVHLLEDDLKINVWTS